MPVHETAHRLDDIEANLGAARSAGLLEPAATCAVPQLRPAGSTAWMGGGHSIPHNKEFKKMKKEK